MYPQRRLVRGTRKRQRWLVVVLRCDGVGRRHLGRQFGTDCGELHRITEHPRNPSQTRLVEQRNELAEAVAKTRDEHFNCNFRGGTLGRLALGPFSLPCLVTALLLGFAASLGITLLGGQL